MAVAAPQLVEAQAPQLVEVPAWADLVSYKGSECRRRNKFELDRAARRTR